MTTRRHFFALGAQTAALTLLSNSPMVHAQDNMPLPAKPRTDVSMSMIELQQRFVDLRFGMFLHFNMATFQDLEWGDPASSPNLFNPTALDTNQWAAAAKSAHMTWGCLTTRQS